MPSTRSIRSTRTRPRPHPGRPHDRSGRDRGPVAETNETVLDRDEPRLRPDLDAALAEPVRRVRRQGGIELGQDPVRGLDHDPAHVDRHPAGVRSERGPCEVLELTDRFDPGEPRPDENEPQRGAAFLSVGGLGGGVELREDPVAEPDRLRQGLEADRVLGESGDRQGPRPRTGADDGHVERFVSPAPVRKPDPCRAAFNLDPLHLTDDELRASEDAPERHDDGAGVDQPARHLGQERLIRHVVLRADHHQLVRVRRQQALEVAGRVQTDVAAADDQDPAHLTLPPGLRRSRSSPRR
jgi:hypothetical protein